MGGVETAIRLAGAIAFGLAAGRAFATGAGTLGTGAVFATFARVFAGVFGAGVRSFVADARGAALRAWAFFTGFAALRALTGLLFFGSAFLTGFGAALVLAFLAVFVLDLALTGARLTGFRARAFARFGAAFFTFFFDPFWAMTPFSSIKSLGNWFDLWLTSDG